MSDRGVLTGKAVPVALASGTEVVTTIKGSSVLIGAVTFPVDGRVLYGVAADRPAAADAHAALEFAYYWAVDTKALSQTTGAAWVVQ